MTVRARVSETSEGSFEQFRGFMKRLVAVPHSEIRARLEAEKAAKKQRPKKKRGASRDSASS
jgi:hypothetical protein